MNDIRDLVLGDLDRHRRHGVDLNPFSTVGARNLWQRGYDGLPLRNMDGAIGSLNHRIHERGRLARELEGAVR